MVGGATREGGGSKDSCVLGLRLGFRGGTFRPDMSPESDFFIAEIRKNRGKIKQIYIY